MRDCAVKFESGLRVALTKMLQLVMKLLVMITPFYSFDNSWILKMTGSAFTGILTNVS